MGHVASHNLFFDVQLLTVLFGKYSLFACANLCMLNRLGSSHPAAGQVPCFDNSGSFIYLFGALRRFQHSTGHIRTGSWKGRGN